MPDKGPSPFPAMLDIELSTSGVIFHISGVIFHISYGVIFQPMLNTHIFKNGCNNLAFKNIYAGLPFTNLNSTQI